MKRNFLKTYGFLICMLIGIVAGCIVGAVWPGATALEPLGTVFINLMFCVVVPMVFCSISSAIANMRSARRAGKLMITTILTFMVTAAIAAVITYIVVRLIPITTADYVVAEGEISDTLSLPEMIINFFTTSGAELLTLITICVTTSSYNGDKALLDGFMNFAPPSA